MEETCLFNDRLRRIGHTQQERQRGYAVARHKDDVRCRGSCFRRHGRQRDSDVRSSEGGGVVYSVSHLQIPDIVTSKHRQKRKGSFNTLGKCDNVCASPRSYSLNLLALHEGFIYHQP